jgi:hypothetical protein
MIAATTAPASASSVAAVYVQGSGGYSPALDAVQEQRAFSFNGFGQLAGELCNQTYAVAPTQVSADGFDQGNLVEGVGTIDVSIGGCPAAGEFVRVGTTLVIALVFPIATVATALCVLVPGQLPPAGVASFSISCGAADISTH